MPLVADYVVFCLWLWLWCIGPVCDSDQVIPQVNDRLQENSTRSDDQCECGGVFSAFTVACGDPKAKKHIRFVFLVPPRCQCRG